MLKSYAFDHSYTSELVYNADANGQVIEMGF